VEIQRKLYRQISKIDLTGAKFAGARHVKWRRRQLAGSIMLITQNGNLFYRSTITLQI